MTPTFRVPAVALEVAALKDSSRLSAYIHLCGRTARAPGSHPAPSRSVPSTVCTLERGQVVASLADMAGWWSVTKASAQKTLAAFEKAGLVVVAPAASAAIEGLPAPDGSLVTVVGL